jgi:hypothetical protein
VEEKIEEVMDEVEKGGRRANVCTSRVRYGVHLLGNAIIFFSGLAGVVINQGLAVAGLLEESVDGSSVRLSSDMRRSSRNILDVVRRGT